MKRINYVRILDRYPQGKYNVILHPELKGCAELDALLATPKEKVKLHTWDQLLVHTLTGGMAARSTISSLQWISLIFDCAKIRAWAGPQWFSAAKRPLRCVLLKGVATVLQNKSKANRERSIRSLMETLRLFKQENISVCVVIQADWLQFQPELIAGLDIYVCEEASC